jgi:hypothetical protein
MNPKMLAPTAFLTILYFLCGSNCGYAEQPGSVPGIPPNANVLTTIDYDVLHQSNWAQVNNVSAGDLIGLPATVNRATFAAEVDYDYWTSTGPVAIVKLDADRDFSRLPVQFANRVDTLGGQPALLLKSRDVAVEMGSQYAIIPNSSRQSASRKVRMLSDTKMAEHDSDVLRGAIQASGGENVFAVMAMDLRDSVSQSAVEEYCESASTLENIDRRQVHELLASVEGVILAITVTDSLNADIRMRFGSDAEMLKDIAAPLLDDLLIGYGAKLENLGEWKTLVAGNVVSVRGELSFDALNDLMGIAIQDPEIPAEIRELSKALNLSDEESASQYRESNAKLAAASEATTSYMLRVRRLLGSLHAKTGMNPGQSRFWLDRYALRIQQLDEEGVDDMATEFADRTTLALRSMADSLESAEIDRYRTGYRLGATWFPVAGVRTYSYGGVPIQRRGNFFGGYGMLAGLAIDRALDRDRRQESLETTSQAGLAVVKDYNVTGDAIGKKYGIAFQPWLPAR